MSDTKKKIDFSKYRILNDGIITKPFEHKEVGGLIVPVGAQEAKNKSTVVAVGPGRLRADGTRSKMWVKVGDVLFHSEFAGSEIEVFGGKYLIMREALKGDVYGIFHGNRPIDINPIEDRILLEWEEGQGTYKGTNIARATSESDKHFTGVVLAVGPDVQEVKVGKRVFFDQFCGPERIDYDGKRYAFIHEPDVYCEIPLREEVRVLSK